jgi:RimJ/RimL family protein N-acetyltransferase
MSETTPQPSERPILNIVGEKVALGPLHRGLLPFLERWDSDFETLDLRGGDIYPRSPERTAAEYEARIAGEQPDWIGFAIYALPDLPPIGTTNIRDFLTPDRTAEFGIAIGEPAFRGQGYGTEAIRLMLDYAFTVLGVHNVWLDTVAHNEPALRAYQRAGFHEIGRRRQARRLGDRFYDVVLMDCLATEFIPPPKRVIRLPE